MEDQMPLDDTSYYRYCGPSRLDKDLHTLEGIIKGIAIDDNINEKECDALADWLEEHQDIAIRHPFNELFPIISAALEDSVIDEEEKRDILWLCNQITTAESYYDEATADIQRLQGILGGIVSDGIVSEIELNRLNKWLQEHEHLRKCWPYDEVEGIIVNVLRDGVIDREEHKELLSFFGQFTAMGDDRVIGNPPIQKEKTVTGVCAIDPEITFKDKSFCFTGHSTKAPRKDIWGIVLNYGGIIHKSVVPYLNYLVIGADGHPCWAYACYGRKVEQAVRLRKEGKDLMIIHEHDFWDAVYDIDG
jgi:NAD-dependent DNA ligase